MERINWHTTELNTPVPGMATETAAIANGPVKWGTSSVGTFHIVCDSGLPEGTLREGNCYAVILHGRDGRVRVLKEGIGLWAAAEECRAEIKRQQENRAQPPQ
jgi:hypothetical protein